MRRGSRMAPPNCSSCPVRVDAAELITDQRFIGEGYGIPSDECLEAIRLLARTEAILLDPCYTGERWPA